MGKGILKCFSVAFLIVGVTWNLALAYEGEEGSAKEGAWEDSLTGEVVDVVCYMGHGQSGLGPQHADCAKKCILGGLPVAIRSGGQLYLAAMSDHTSANQTLANFAGREITVHGKVTEQDGMKFIAVEHIEEH